jgi:hypothetical protein
MEFESKILEDLRIIDEYFKINSKEKIIKDLEDCGINNYIKNEFIIETKFNNRNNIKLNILQSSNDWEGDGTRCQSNKKTKNYAA